MMLTTRFWGSTTALLCTLLLQNCQSSSLRALEEEGLAAGSSSSAMRQCASSAPLVVQSSPLTPPSASPAAHVPPSRFSTPPANKKILSTALFSHSLSPPARSVLATVGNSPRAPHNLQLAARPGSFHAVPLGNKPGRTPSPNGSRVYLGKVALLDGMLSDEKENEKPPAKRRFSNPDDERAKGHEKALGGERCAQGCVRRDILNLLLTMAESEPDKAAEFLEVLLVAAQDKQFRQRALEALNKVAKAPPGMLSQCLPSLRAAAREGEDKAMRLLALKTLGEVEWRQYFGDVESAPALPSDIDAVLDSACPFWPAKKVKDTHLLVLIPASVDGAPFTLNLLKELIQGPRYGGHETRYRYYSDNVKAQFGEASPSCSYWLLMTRDVLEGSRKKVYSAQRALVTRYARRTGQPYEVPGALETATAILMHHVRTGERLLGNGPWTYARCQELIGGKYPILIGGFESSGLFVSSDFSYDYADRGVACCRKF